MKRLKKWNSKNMKRLSRISDSEEATGDLIANASAANNIIKR